MFQQIIALIVIAFFLGRLIQQKKKKNIGRNEFLFWLIFWIVAAGAIISIKWIDQLVNRAGFSSQGIDILFYIAVVLLFYFVFRIRLRLERIEKNITKISRKMAISEKEDNKK